jgi:hypothetical protein
MKPVTNKANLNPDGGRYPGRLLLGLAALCCVVLLAGGVKEKPLELKSLLHRAAAYFSRLEEMSIQYFCRESIRETIYPIPAQYKGYFIFKTGPENLWVKLHFGNVRASAYEYDYQVVRRGRAGVKERRNLLRENGVEKHLEDVRLATRIFNFDTMVLGPMIFDPANQGQYTFRVLGREQALGREADVVESRPGSTGAEEMAWGKYWIDVADGSFLRMNFSQTSIRNFATIEKKAEALQSTPQIGILLECGAERAGVRFPTRILIEEAYVHQDGTRFVLSTLEVAYRDYRFFGVDVKVDERGENR